MNTDPITRRSFLESGGAAMAAQAAVPARAADSRKPNFILYMPETMRAESLACYGHPVVRTPNFDRFAGEGVRFSQCHVQNTVCGPSRCSLMTGWPVHVRGHRSLYYPLQPDEPNLFRYLKQAGYDVFWYGKNDLLAPGSFPDSVTDWGTAPGRPPGRLYPPGDPHFYSFLAPPGGDRTDTADWRNIQSAIRVLERGNGKPFCLFLPLTFVHPPFTAPKDFYGMYDPAKLPSLRPPGLPRKPNYQEALRGVMRLDRLNDADFRKIQAVYLGMISYSDWMFGELLAAVERTGHAQDTAVFLFSDHGEWGGDYGLVEKWPSAMDGVLEHVPLMARYEGLARGHVSDEIVELYDVMATVLELAGIEARHTHFARSLMPQLHGRPGDPARAAFAEGGYNVNEPQDFEPLDQFASPDNIYYPKVSLQNRRPETITRATMIRTRTHKLVFRPDGQSELYDLAGDPRELHNVYGDSGYSAIAGDLRQQTLDWYIRTADVAPKQRFPRNFPPRQ